MTGFATNSVCVYQVLRNASSLARLLHVHFTERRSKVARSVTVGADCLLESYDDGTEGLRRLSTYGSYSTREIDSARMESEIKQ